MLSTMDEGTYYMLYDRVLSIGDDQLFLKKLREQKYRTRYERDGECIQYFTRHTLGICM